MGFVLSALSSPMGMVIAAFFVIIVILFIVDYTRTFEGVYALKSEVNATPPAIKTLVVIKESEGKHFYQPISLDSPHATQKAAISATDGNKSPIATLEPPSAMSRVWTATVGPSGVVHELSKSFWTPAWNPPCINVKIGDADHVAYCMLDESK